MTGSIASPSTPEITPTANKAYTWYCKEIPHNQGPAKLHIITTPHRNEPTGYTQLISVSAFQNGKRRYSSPEDKATYRDRNCWGPQALFSVKRGSEWEFDQKMEQACLEKCGIVMEKPEEFHYTSIFEFYKAIGFDRLTRCYRDKKGNPIKFSVSRRKPRKEKELAPA